MIPLERIAAGFASDLTRSHDLSSPLIKSLLSQAFLRGFTLGRAILPPKPTLPNHSPTEPRPWTPTR